MFFSTRHTLKSEVETIARTAVDALLINLAASGVVLKIDSNQYASDPNFMESVAESLRPEQPTRTQPNTPEQGVVSATSIKDLEANCGAPTGPDFRMSDGRGLHIGNGTMVNCTEQPD